jgi:hypothetical protein
MPKRRRLPLTFWAAVAFVAVAGVIGSSGGRSRSSMI